MVGDADGRRVIKSTSGGTTIYVYGPDGELAGESSTIPSSVDRGDRVCDGGPFGLDAADDGQPGAVPWVVTIIYRSGRRFRGVGAGAACRAKT